MANAIMDMLILVQTSLAKKQQTAKEALMFLNVSINGYWKIPIGYFLIDGTTADQKSTLIKQCLFILK